MNTTVYTHPTLEHFLRFHLGSHALMMEASDPQDMLQYYLRLLNQQEFPFENINLGENVYRYEYGPPAHPPANGTTAPKLMCTAGESSLQALTFLIEKVLVDQRNDRKRKYGPIVLVATRQPRAFVDYYDRVVQKVFKESVTKSLYADPATMKTSWYGQVNAHLQKKYLDDVIRQLMTHEGISKLLTAHLGTEKGELILGDSMRAASLAISLMQQVNRMASDRLMYTLALACTVQHFGCLVSEEEAYYPGKRFAGTNDETIEVLSEFGILSEEAEDHPFVSLGIDPGEVLEVVRYRSGPPPDATGKNLPLIYSVAIANLIVATYFTEETRIYEGGELIPEYNPTFGNVDRTMAVLDESFDDAYFYLYHRSKIESFIRNADRYYRMHMEHQLRDGKYVSEVQRQALELKG